MSNQNGMLAFQTCDLWNFFLQNVFHRQVDGHFGQYSIAPEMRAAIIFSIELIFQDNSHEHKVYPDSKILSLIHNVIYNRFTRLLVHAIN